MEQITKQPHENQGNNQSQQQNEASQNMNSFQKLVSFQASYLETPVQSQQKKNGKKSIQNFVSKENERKAIQLIDMEYSTHPIKTIHNQSSSKNRTPIKSTQNRQRKTFDSILLMSNSSEKNVNRNQNDGLLVKNESFFGPGNYRLKQKFSQNTYMQRNSMKKGCWRLSSQVYKSSRVPFKNELENSRQKNNPIHQKIIDLNQIYSKIDLVNTQASWFSTFVSTQSKKQDKSDNFSEEDSFQYLDKNTPGPGHYLNKNIKALQNAQADRRQNCSTFGGAQRFDKIRPITADVGLAHRILQTKNANIPQEVAFTTSKNNERTQIKKVLYCDWSRPHFYGDAPDIASKNKKEDPTYTSTVKRFIYPKCQTPGPYFKLKFDEKSDGLPCHYFISDVERSAKPSQIDRRDFMKNNQKLQVFVKKPQSGKKKQKVKRTKQNEIDLKDEIPDQIPKNSVGQRNRKVTHKNLYKNPQFTNKNSPYEQNSDDQEYTPKPIEMQNSWVSPSFNIKFQVNQRNVRA